MTPRNVRQWMTRVGLLGAMALVMSGCPEDAADIVTQVSAPSFNFPIASGYIEPAGEGSLENFVLADVDPTVNDAFGRAVSFLTPAASFFTCGGDCPAWEFPIDNSSQDSRGPALQDPDGGGDIAITPDSVLGGAATVFSLTDLNPSTSYRITLERLALTVNAGLDHENELLNNPALGGFQRTPDAPDALALLGGTPGTTRGSNPYEIGGFTTDATGASGFGFFFFDGGGGSDIIETNSLASFSLPQYNYLVVYEGPVSAGVVALRAQVGVDLDATGAPVNNALGPFPTAALTVAEVLAAPGGAGRPDEIEVVYNNLDALTGGAVYEGWLINSTSGNALLATGTYNKIQIIAERDPITGDIISTRDSVVETVSPASSFVGGNEGDGFRHELIVTDASLGGGALDTVGFYEDLVLTTTASPGGSAPASSQPFWFFYTDQNGTPDNFFDDEFDPDDGETNFGNFEMSDRSLNRVYSGEGLGLGGVREGILSVDIQALSRPPVGYVLTGWIFGVPATFEPVQTDPITGPAADFVDITSADTELTPGVVTATGILDANFRLDGNTAAIDYTKFGFFVVSLKPKLGSTSGIGSIPVQQGELPERVVSPPE